MYISTTICKELFLCAALWPSCFLALRRLCGGSAAALRRLRGGSAAAPRRLRGGSAAALRWLCGGSVAALWLRGCVALAILSSGGLEREQGVDVMKSHL